MQNKQIKLIQPTVEEFIKALQQFPPDAVVTESEIGGYIGVCLKYSHDHWDDDGFGNPSARALKCRHFVHWRKAMSKYII